MQQTQSKLGLASFVLSVVAAGLTLSTVVVAGVMQASTRGGLDAKPTWAVVLGLAIFAFTALDLVALGLGIAGLVQKDRKKTFAALGTGLSAVTIFMTIALMVVGVMAKK